jgi:hypothetical protein
MYGRFMLQITQEEVQLLLDLELPEDRNLTGVLCP